MKQRLLHFLLVLGFIFGTLSAVAQENHTAPVGLNVQSFQHELVLTWQSGQDHLWEVQLDNDPPIRCPHPFHTFERLPHNHPFTIKLRAIRGEQASDTATLHTATQNLNKAINDPDRIPYLRTIRIDGIAPRRLPLYFNELANPKAHITYKWNGQTMAPVDNHLLLSSSSYKDKLELHIDEGEGRTWNITYLISLERQP